MYSYEHEYDPFVAEGKICAHCGAAGLQWHDFGSGFKLYDGDLKRHVCPAIKPSADDFEVL